MSRRALAFTSVLLVCAAAAAVDVASCTVETTPLPAVCDTGTPSLRIISPVADACVEVSAGADAYIPVLVDAQNFQIRPPGSCSSCVNCGHVVLRVNDLDNNASTSSVVDVDFAGKLANHYGTMNLTVELVDDCGRPWTAFGQDGGVLDCDAGVVGSGDGGTVEPLVMTVTITSSPSCGSGSSSSTGTGSTSSSSTSTSSASGTGGAGSSSSATGAGGASSSSATGAGGASSSSATGAGGASSSSATGAGGTSSSSASSSSASSSSASSSSATGAGGAGSSSATGAGGASGTDAGAGDAGDAG